MPEKRLRIYVIYCAFLTIKILLLTIKTRRTGAAESIDQILTSSIILTRLIETLIKILVTVKTRVSRYTIALVTAGQVLAVTKLTNILNQALVNILVTVETFVTLGTGTAVVADQVGAGCSVLARVGGTLVNILVTIRALVAKRTSAIIGIHKVNTNFIISWAQNAFAVVYVHLAALSCIALHALAFELVARAPLLRGWVALSPV